MSRMESLVSEDDWEYVSDLCGMFLVFVCSWIRRCQYEVSSCFAKKAGHIDQSLKEVEVS